MAAPTETSGGTTAASLREAAAMFALAAEDAALRAAIDRVADLTTESLRRGGRLFLCGNGGSAAEATHLAGELIGPFYDRQRPAYAAIPLGFDPGSLTASANDFGYDHALARQLEGLGRPGDVLWALSTSGRSANILAVLRRARELSIASVLLTNDDGGPARDLVDHLLLTPPGPTPRVQEVHLLIGHCLCERIEAALGRPQP